MKVNTKDLISDFQTKYKKLAEEITAAQAKIRTESQALVNDIFKEYFEKYGEVVYAIHWTQGTPGFNDGDPCYFSVHEKFLSFTEEGYDSGEGDMHDFDLESEYEQVLTEWDAYDIDPTGAYELAKATYERNYPYARNSFTAFSSWTPSSISREEAMEKLQWVEDNREKFQAAIEDFNIIDKALDHIDSDYMEMIYGDNKKVTYFGPDGRLETDEYDMGY